MIRELGDGLILRRATVDDTEKLVAFHAAIHSQDGVQAPDERVGAWTRDLMAGTHPIFQPDDFTIVEDTGRGEIVSSLCMISQTWTYDGIPFGVGQPELVGTNPDYRRRGLIRAQFEVIHGWSAERGELVQGITGIPNYYRQFGYEMGLALGGGRLGYRPLVQKLEDGQAEPYRVRPALPSDLPFIARVYEGASRRWRVACARSDALWRYELEGKGERSVQRVNLCVVEAAAGQAVGLLAHMCMVERGRLFVTAYELAPGVSWLAVTPSVLRHLWATGDAIAARDGKELDAVALWLGAEHPVYPVIRERLPLARPPYAWYVRVADLPAFLRHIAPALERRLAESAAAGHTGELKISFYGAGVRLAFEGGRLVTAGPWTPTQEAQGGPAFPDLTFLQLLFGYRSLEELRYAFPDCGTGGDEPRVLLEALFPKQPSCVWHVT